MLFDNEARSTATLGFRALLAFRRSRFRGSENTELCLEFLSRQEAQHESLERRIKSVGERTNMVQFETRRKTADDTLRNRRRTTESSIRLFATRSCRVACRLRRMRCSNLSSPFRGRGVRDFFFGDPFADSPSQKTPQSSSGSLGQGTNTSDNLRRYNEEKSERATANRDPARQ